MSILYIEIILVFVYRRINTSFIADLGIDILPGFSDPVKGRLLTHFMFGYITPVSCLVVG